MMTFLKTFLIILLVYYCLKFLFKLLAPHLMRYVAKKAGQRFEQSFGTHFTNTPENKQKEGSVTVDKMPASKVGNKTKLGDYVDYEEIE